MGKIRESIILNICTAEFLKNSAVQFLFHALTNDFIYAKINLSTMRGAIVRLRLIKTILPISIPSVIADIITIRKVVCTIYKVDIMIHP